MAVIIEIENQQKKIPLIPSQIARTVRKILHYEGVKAAQLSIVFVTDRKIKALNRKYLRHDYSTDVLAFDFTDFDYSKTKASLVSYRNSRKNIPALTKNIKLSSPQIDGEIIISASTAYNNAKKFKTAPHIEIILYLVHGILHLLGYDDHSGLDVKRMRQKEKEIMGILEKYIR